MYLVLMALAAIILAALITLPTAKSGGVGRIVVFVLLSLVGVAAAVVIDHEGLLPPTAGEKAEHTRDVMIEKFEEQAQAELAGDAPSTKALADTDLPTVWRFKGGMTLLCSATDFPDSAELICWAPDGAIAEGVTVDHDEIGASEH